MSRELNYQHIKAYNEARVSEEHRTEQRKKSLLILVLHFLYEEGYLDSMRCLEAEAGDNLKKFQLCDNVDLQTILQEYESYYYVKFNKYPKITKKVQEVTSNKSQPVYKSQKSKSSFSLPSILSPTSNHDSKRCSSSKYPSQACPSLNNSLTKSNVKEDLTKELSDHAKPLEVCGVSRVSLNQKYCKEKQQKLVDSNSILSNTLKEMTLSDAEISNTRLIKPLSGYAGFTGEFRELAAIVSRDIYLENPNVHWNDIIGLDSAKRLVKESVVYPIKYPQLFTGILSPWKGLLLYGPPGTGKTLLAKAVATECNTTFFNISASSIVSKWRGDSEKLVRVLFELARFHAPSTIFLDELDSIMGQRGSVDGGNEHEGSRRMKTEILIQMDGLSKTDDLVFLLAASNIPWELDYAMLRRLEKRILVGLPNEEARLQMIKHFLPESDEFSNFSHVTSRLNYQLLAEKMEGYSGSDIRLVCKEAAMQPVRKIFDVLEDFKDGCSLPEFRIDPITTCDFESALERTKPSAKNLLSKYEEWKDEFESS
ncbi:katanin p60 ATPase-containing subunit A-like 2 isoform X1 [Hydra vulgaris]|uniref:Katanin p60 ATPase-containing subunit A-like 2 n=1 Tax=Hydra vulgaris TaxID=6087 RepID=A0ABM4DD70_HYDVU